jgi:hypothetical protein
VWILLVVACTASLPAETVFVRGGLVVPGEGEGQAVGGGRRFVDRAWTPGEELIRGVVAPRIPACTPLFHVPLADASAAVARGGEPPDTVLAFSPDGAWLAVGAWTGEVVVVDAWTGDERARVRLAETSVREVAWSPDGATLYAAEQSPDAYVHALDAATLASRARLRLADHVESSPAPPGDDLYGLYTLPAAYALRVLADGDVLVAATHGWDDGGVRRNASRVLRLRPGLGVVATWPSGGAADAVLGAFDTDGTRVAVAVRRSAAGPPPVGLPIDGVQLLEAGDLTPTETLNFPVLPPYESVFLWDALALVPGGLVAGLADGRIVLRVDGSSSSEPVGVPAHPRDVPITAGVGFLRARGDDVYAVTSLTTIPYGSERPDLRPPAPHPNENTLFAWTRQGVQLRTPVWSAHLPHVLAGLAVSATEVVVGAGPRDDGRTDLFGAAVFARDGDGTPLVTCSTDAPAFFRPALAEDGRVAVAEVPYRDGAAVRGTYRITVFR